MQIDIDTHVELQTWVRYRRAAIYQINSVLNCRNRLIRRDIKPFPKHSLTRQQLVRGSFNELSMVQTFCLTDQSKSDTGVRL